MANLPGRIFLTGIWQGVILATQTFFKTKKKRSVNIEQWIKSKLACPLCAKGLKLRYVVQNGTGAMTTVKNEVFIGL